MKEMDKCLKTKLIQALGSMNGYQHMMDDDTEASDFHQTSRFNYYSLIITMIYLKLEEDGYIEKASDTTNVKENDYNYVPFGRGDIDVNDAPKCALIKKAYLDAGFVFPEEVNFLDTEASAFNYGYGMAYAPTPYESYSVHHDDAARVSTAAFELVLDNLLGFDDDGNDIAAAFSFITGKSDEFRSDEDELLDIDEAKRYIADRSDVPIALFGMQHTRWSKVRKKYHEALKQQDTQFPTEEYLVLDREVAYFEDASCPYGVFGSFSSELTLDDGTTTTIESISDLNDSEDGGYGHTSFFANPLSFVPPDCVLTLPELKEKVDAFCEKHHSIIPDA